MGAGWAIPAPPDLDLDGQVFGSGSSEPAPANRKVDTEVPKSSWADAHETDKAGIWIPPFCNDCAQEIMCTQSSQIPNLNVGLSLTGRQPNITPMFHHFTSAGRSGLNLVEAVVAGSNLLTQISAMREDLNNTIPSLTVAQPSLRLCVKAWDCG